MAAATIAAASPALQARASHELDAHQLWLLTFVTRFASTLSALGVITIITTFALSRHFRNPMHRLIVINAFYNALDVVCTMISTSGWKDGDASPLCQFQGFLNQMFPVADVMWTLAMAINVYLIVFNSYDASMLRKLEWKYAVAITTFCFIPAFVGLFISTPEKGPFYGGVTLWCAIGRKWVLFRIVIYYVPIWIGIIVTIVLYLIVGIEIVRRRRILRSISRTNSTSLSSIGVLDMDDTIGARAPGARASQPPPPPPDSRETYITIEYSPRSADGADGFSVDLDSDMDDRSPRTTTWVESPGGSSAGSANDKRRTKKKHYTPSTTHINPPARDRSRRRNTIPGLPSTTTSIQAADPGSAASSLSFRQYILMPLFFFIALLLVWMCPSTNRVAVFANPDFFSYELHLMVGITGSLRGFWNGIVFIVVGMRSWRRRKEGLTLESMRSREAR
ncbi:hypothetical protein VTJ83DRAFT_4643 [Remersonia thermophila]|uniref:G-protein coupled receptors family 2 profile 2 domain-containing protein n=1 Tax=Remersonia thermophila TaxID=72144 RepID=A0ABR4DC06_9PEZI